jgi:hypothetical protein
MNWFWSADVRLSGNISTSRASKIIDSRFVLPSRAPSGYPPEFQSQTMAQGYSDQDSQ